MRYLKKIRSSMDGDYRLNRPSLEIQPDYGSMSFSRRFSSECFFCKDGLNFRRMIVALLVAEVSACALSSLVCR